MTTRSLVAVILAAGAGTRFGGGKARALLAGRPLVAHVLGAARAAGIDGLVLVLGRDAALVRAALLATDPAALDGALVALNPAPERGIASSLRLGLAAATAGAAPAGALVLLADQPRVRPDVVRALAAAVPAAPRDALAVVPAYADDGAPNPVLVLPAGIAVARTLAGDRGLGPLLASAGKRVVRVPVPGSNPDVDTPADLEALEGASAERASRPVRWDSRAAGSATPGAGSAPPPVAPGPAREGSCT